MKILLASDGSTNALDAAKFITGLAINNEIDVHLIQVLADERALMAGSMNPWATVWNATANQDQIHRVSQCHVDVLSMLSDACESVSMSHPRGDACFCILEEAERRDVDMIVMGARGHSMLDRVLLGSVSEFVATHANCSVVVVRPRDHVQVGEPPKKLVIGYDRSREAYDAVREMNKLAWMDDTDINLLGIAPVNLPFQSDDADDSEAMRLRIAGENLAGNMGMPNASNQIVHANHAGDALVRNAEESNADVILLGETSHGTIGQWILGSTTKYVLRHASCSVWVSRHHRKDGAKSKTVEQSPGETVT